MEQVPDARGGNEGITTLAHTAVDDKKKKIFKTDEAEGCKKKHKYDDTAIIWNTKIRRRRTNKKRLSVPRARAVSFCAA